MKNAKRFICVFNLLASIPFTACAGGWNAELPPKELARAIIESLRELPELCEVSSDEEFSDWVANCYLLEAEQVSGGAVFYAEGAEVSEIAVLVLSDPKHGAAVQKSLETYRASRAELFGYYAPAQAAIAKKGAAVVSGNCAALLICADTAAAKAAFSSCLKKSARPSQGGKIAERNQPRQNPPKAENASSPAPSEGYDAPAILRAYTSGDDSALSEKNREILRAATKAISQNITDGMSDYQKELAVHDYITRAKFDWAVLGHGGVSENSRTPYGVLIERSAMCHGFSLCFQLFMDMLGIECVTVYSTSESSTPHSWNVVNIEGDWYCVDTAWDSTSGHAYFNVTSRHLKSKGYRWNESSVPEANGTKYAYRR
ncbi:MAG: DUF4358 domain-containing protein [Treponemataceae bacterium]|nr:DUF4358 domain-containing protein [Treponemataceae bacterium]